MVGLRHSGRVTWFYSTELITRIFASSLAFSVPVCAVCRPWVSAVCSVCCGSQAQPGSRAARTAIASGWSDVVDSIYQDGRRYDSLFGDDPGAVRFWLNQLIKLGGPVLELASGTGKYLLPLSAAGVDIVGLDRSEPMLAEARRKVGEAAHSLKLVAGDMRAFQFRMNFRCVLIAGNSLCHLLTNRDLESCLKCIRDHLDPGGWLLIDVFVPDVHLLSREAGTRYPFARFLDPVDGQDVVMEYTHVYDSATQVNHVTTFTRRGSSSEEVGRLTMRMYFPQELDALLWHNGFAIHHKFGGYQEELFGADSQKQLVIATLA
jgi:SAM-dependent methyltransferase